MCRVHATIGLLGLGELNCSLVSWLLRGIYFLLFFMATRIDGCFNKVVIPNNKEGKQLVCDF